MALLFADGFGTYATADISKLWTSVTGSASINTTEGRRSGGCLKFTNVNQAVSITLSSAESTLVVGVAYKTSAMPSTTPQKLLAILDAGTIQASLRVNLDGTFSVYRNDVTVLGTSSASININEFNYIEFKTVIHDTTGSYEVRLNGVNILSASSVDTKHTANATANQVSISTIIGGSQWSDDFYIETASFLGDIRIDAITATGDGNYTQWTPSTGTTHYTLVDDATPNTTDYVSDGTNGNKDSYTMSDVPALTAQTIYGVVVRAAALKDDAGSRSIKVGVRSGSTDSVSAAQALSESQAYYTHILATDPNTSAAWTESGVNALETLIETAA